MSEFSAILDVLACVVSEAFEATLDIVCTAILGASFIAVWRLGEICSSFSGVNTRSKYREKCFESAGLSLFDAILLPLTLFIVLSPMRWSVVHLIFSTAYAFPNRYDAWDIRYEMFACATGSMWDMFGYIFGFVALFSPFGRVVTICRSTDYYFRANQDSEEKCKSLNRWSTKLILQGLTTVLDVIAVMIALPCILLVPSLWIPTYNGLVEIHLPENLPKDLTNTKNYQRSWMDGYYPLVRLHLFNQVFHALMDLLLLPLFLLVCISPLRQPALWRAINVNKAERIRQEKGYARYRPDVSAFDYYYSFDLRADLCVLALLALADLLLLPMMLPLWLTQYRFTALKEELWPVQEEPAVVEETEKVDPALSRPTPDQENGGDVTNAELHDIYADIEASRDPPHATHTESDLHDSQSAPASGASQMVPSTDAPTQEPPRSKLLGMREFFLVSSQAALLFVDIFMLALPLPILYLTALRWGPVGRALREDKVFLKNSSGLYGTVMEQMSLLLLDVLLAPFAGLILLTVYRSSALWEVLSSLALIEALGNKLHWAVILNTLCILHDVFLLTPAVLLLPCFLAGYRFSIVYNLLSKHIAAQKKEQSDLQARRDARSVVLLASETDNAAAVPVAAINNQSFIQGVDLGRFQRNLIDIFYILSSSCATLFSSKQSPWRTASALQEPSARTCGPSVDTPFWMYRSW